MKEPSTIERLLYKICPHYWRQLPNRDESVLVEVTKNERCRICGKGRMHAKLRKPHPSRNKEELLEKMQHPGFEVVVTEWLPHEDYTDLVE